MFYGCSSLASLDLSGWDTSNVTSMSWMFYGCSSLREVSLGPATRVELPASSGGDVSGRWVSSADGVAYRLSDVPAGVAATYTAQLAESEASGLNSLGSCVWTIGEGGALTISPLPGCASGELCGLEGSGSPFSRYGAEVASVRIAPGVKASGSLSGLFSGLSSAASMDLSGLDVSSVTDMSSMFSGCSSLRKISLGEATRVDLPTPSGDGLTGRWVSSADGVAYRPSDIPLGVAATYAAQRSDSAAGVANSAGSCTWKIDADGVLVIAPCLIARRECLIAGELILATRYMKCHGLRLLGTSFLFMLSRGLESRAPLRGCLRIFRSLNRWTCRASTLPP